MNPMVLLMVNLCSFCDGNTDRIVANRQYRHCEDKGCFNHVAWPEIMLIITTRQKGVVAKEELSQPILNKETNYRSSNLSVRLNSNAESNLLPPDDPAKRVVLLVQKFNGCNLRAPFAEGNPDRIERKYFDVIAQRRVIDKAQPLVVRRELRSPLSLLGGL